MALTPAAFSLFPGRCGVSGGVAKSRGGGTSAAGASATSATGATGSTSATGAGSAGPSDEELLTRFQTGERAAFAELLKRHKNGLYHFVLRHTRVPAVAEDVVQDAFVRVVQNAQDFKHEARFSTWLYTIARNLCIDHMRKHALRKHPSLDQRGSGGGDGEEGPTLGEQTADSKIDVERAATGNELKDRIAKAVELLPEDQREVFLLREVSNLPFKEIAEVTGVPENTVKSRMRYALERLQEALSEYEEFAHDLK